MSVDQILIAVLGVLCVYLTQHCKESVRRYASVVALIGQPFWFYSSYHAEQWGIFSVGFIYLAIWLRSFWRSWIARK